MPTTLSVIPPVVPEATAAAGGAAVRLLQAGHIVVPSAICVPHPLQKAIDISHTQFCPETASGRVPIRSSRTAKVTRIRGLRQTDSCQVDGRHAWTLRCPPRLLWLCLGCRDRRLFNIKKLRPRVPSTASSKPP